MIELTKLVWVKTSCLITFTVVISSQNDECILEKRNENYGVDDEGENRYQVVLVANAIRESAGIYIKWGSSDISIHHSNALKC